MKRTIIVLCSIFISLQAAFSGPKDDAGEKYAGAESMKKGLESRADLTPFIPYDMFGLGLTSLERARVFLGDGKYNDASFHAQEASIRFEIASLVAQARSARYERMKLLGESCSAGIMTNPVMDAQFFKKGNVFRANLYDRDVFVTRKDRVYYRISADGKDRFDKIVKVMNSYPNYTLKIVGHTSEQDHNDYARQKADIVAKYLYEKSIAADRIEVVGMGNREVMETHLGFRRVDRVEFILSAPR